MILTAFIYYIAVLLPCIFALSLVLFFMLRYKTQMFLGLLGSMFSCSLAMVFTLIYSCFFIQNTLYNTVVLTLILNMVCLVFVFTPYTRKGLLTKNVAILAKLNAGIYIALLAMQAVTWGNVFVNGSHISLAFSLGYLILPGLGVLSTTYISSIRLNEKSLEKKIFNSLKFFNIIPLLSVIDVYRVYNAILNERFEHIFFIFSLYIFIATIIISVKLINYAKVKTDDKHFCEPSQTLLNSFNITAREKEIILKVLTGESNSSIALSLHVKESTVKQHLNNIFKKCQVLNRWELITLFHR